MEDAQLIKLWNSYDKKLNDTYQLIQNNVQDISRIKAKSIISSMKPIKIFGVLAGIIWVGVVGFFLARLFVSAYYSVSPFFLYSAALQVILTAIAVITYLYQLILIYNVDISDQVIKTQETLVRLKISTLWITRILCLQLPLWTTFYLSKSMFVANNLGLIVIQTIVTMIFTCLAIWLFVNIKYENRHKRWFKILFNGKEWLPILNSMHILEQINSYKY